MKCDQRIPIFRRGYRLQWEEMQNCHVILYPEGMAKLNDSATMILELVDGQRSLADIARTLNVRFRTRVALMMTSPISLPPRVNRSG